MQQFNNHQAFQSHQQYAQQAEFERLCQVQRQASLQQQNAMMLIMQYQQELEGQQYQYQQQQQQQQLLYEDRSLGFFAANCPPHQNPSFPVIANNSSLLCDINYFVSGSTTADLSDDKSAKRAEHNAVERARRELLNKKLQQLAHSLPTLSDPKASKGIIIAHTLQYVKDTVQKEQKLESEIGKLRRANKSLISQMTTYIDALDDDEQYGDEQYDDEHYDDEPEDNNELLATPKYDDDSSSQSSFTSESSQPLFYSQLEMYACEV